MLISDGVGVGGSITIKGTSVDFAVSAAADACSMVGCAPTQLGPSQSHTSSGSRSVINPKCNPWYSVQWFPNTGSLMCRPPPFLAASVQYIFPPEGMSDCSQK